jgi:hypothetical protein
VLIGLLKLRANGASASSAEKIPAHAQVTAQVNG